MNNWKDNIHFILVEPKEPGNIGASARAIKNMGFRNLCLVNPLAVITDEARWLACNALDVLESAKTYHSLNDAIKGKSIVTGTTRRKGKRRGVIMPVEDAARRIFDIARCHNEIAILFGREDRGLFNEEVEECGFLITIPTSKEQPSLNLAQSVLIVAYELFKSEYRTQNEGSPKNRKIFWGEGEGSPKNRKIFWGEGTEDRREVECRLVSHEELISLYKRIAETLRLLEYIPRGDRNLEKKIMLNLKRFIGRAGITDWELKMLHGICSQIEKKCK